jgi:hypothetical protein
MDTLHTARQYPLTIFVAWTSALLSSCSSITTSRTTNDIKIDQVVVTKHGVDGYFRPAGIVTADATVTVTYENGGKKRIVEGEDFRADFDGPNRTERAKSQYFVGTSLPVVTAGGLTTGGMNWSNVIGGSASSFQDDKKYATDTVNYRLIKEARAAGAVALLDEPVYEWSQEEESKYETVFFFFDSLRSKKVIYRVTATAQTATIEYRSTILEADDLTKARAATPPASVGAADNPPRAATPSSSLMARPESSSALPTTRIEITRRSFLDLDTSVVRALKQLIGSEVAVILTTGETKQGALGKVERNGLTIAGATVSWGAIVSVEATK